MKRLAALLLALSSMAAGGTINGTLGWSPEGNAASFQGPELGASSSVTVSATEFINTIPPIFDGAPNDFLESVALGNLVLIPPAYHTLLVTNINGGFHPDVLTDYAAWGTNGFFRYVFSASEVNWSSSASTNLSLLANGTLIDRDKVFEPTPGHISESYTTTGEGAVNVSFTFSSEQVPVSENGSGLGTLAGVLLICGLSAGRRRALPQ